MRFLLFLFSCIILLTELPCGAQGPPQKDHDFIPKIANLVFVSDLSSSMMFRYSRDAQVTRLCLSAASLDLFNSVMPPVPLWQYEVRSALLSFGDNRMTSLLSPLDVWNRDRLRPLFQLLSLDRTNPARASSLNDALLVAGRLLGEAQGRSAILVMSDGGTGCANPQQAALGLKNQYGDRLKIYGIFFGDNEAGWRNLYEVCKLTGGYTRTWRELRDRKRMQEFARDICVEDITFPYSEIFFRQDSSLLLPSEALKLEAVAAFLHSQPQYALQVDGYATASGRTQESYGLGIQRAQQVRKYLERIYKVRPGRIFIRSWGEKFPRYDNHRLDTRPRNDQAVLYLRLHLSGSPYDEKRVNTHGEIAIGSLYNTIERGGDTEWAQPIRLSR